MGPMKALTMALLPLSRGPQQGPTQAPFCHSAMSLVAVEHEQIPPSTTCDIWQQSVLTLQNVYCPGSIQFLRLTPPATRAAPPRQVEEWRESLTLTVRVSQTAVLWSIFVDDTDRCARGLESSKFGKCYGMCHMFSSFIEL